MTENELSAADIDAVKEMISRASLASIDYYEVSASRLDAEQAPDDIDENNLTVSVEYRGVEGGGFGVRLLAEVVLPHGRARACVAGEYRLEDGYEPAERVCLLFVNEVAVMTVYPYLREAMSTASARVFAEPIHLPIIERGQVSMEVPDE